MGEKEKDREPGIKVTDHRRIHLDAESGEVTSEAEAESSPEAEAAPAPEPPFETPPRPSQAAMDEAERKADAAASKRAKRTPPAMDFTTFVLSLGSSALVHLGDAPHPDTNQPEPNLPMAKQTIDMLSMLREKTKGNLDRDEASYLDALLYDLRMRFVEASKRHG